MTEETPGPTQRAGSPSPALQNLSHPSEVLAALDLLEAADPEHSSRHSDLHRPVTLEVDAHLLSGLCRRLETQPAIEQAKGILMSAYRLDDQRAFRTLQSWSHSSNLKLRDLAVVLTEGQASTRLPPAALVRAALKETQPSAHPTPAFEPAE